MDEYNTQTRHTPIQSTQLTLVTGVAVAETLKKELNLDVGIKWPNDILIGNKKVCGILTEVNASINKVNYVIVGIGIDMNVDVPFSHQTFKRCNIS